MGQGKGTTSGPRWRLEVLLAVAELASAALLLHVFALTPEQMAAGLGLFVLGLVVSAVLVRRRLADRARAGRFLVAPVVVRAVGWALAVTPFAATSWEVLFFAAYFGVLHGGLRGVAYRRSLDAMMARAPADEQGRYARATLFERVVLSADALGLIAADALVLFVLWFMDFDAEQVRKALVFVPWLAGPTLAARWRFTRRVVRDVLVEQPAQADLTRRRARRLPAVLAIAQFVSWLLVAAVGAAFGANRLGLNLDDQVVVIALAALLVWGVVLYQMRWHRSVVARLEPTLPGAPLVPDRPQSLRSRMVLMFGFPVLFACAGSMFASAMQYRQLATRLLEYEAGDRAEQIAERVGAALARGGADAMSRQVHREQRPPMVIVVATAGRRPPLQVGTPPTDLLSLPGVADDRQVLPESALRLVRQGKRDYVQVGSPLMTGAIRPLPGTPPPGGVAVLLPGYRGEGRLGQLLGLLAFSLALAVVAGGVVAWASQELAVPVRALDRTADSIASGQLDAKVSSISGPAELSQLAASLERMRSALVDKIGTIEQLHLDLEAKVQQRTGELREANRELEAAVESFGQAQAQLVHTEKMAALGQLVAGVAHELNNPLNFILNTLAPLDAGLKDLERLLDAYGRLETAADDPTLERAVADLHATKADVEQPVLQSELGQMARVVRTGAERAVKIVAGLRTFSRARVGGVAPYQLDQGVDDALLLVEHGLREAGVRVVRERGQVPPIPCHGGEITQVLLHLLTNAAQSGGRQVVVRTAVEGDQAVVEIADDGAGIPADRLSRIFDPFYTTKPVGGGTGLGLSIALGIVRAHGGTIDVSSRLGEGARFSVRLPLRPATAAEP